MREKNHADKLSLQWSESSSADNSQTERDILDELCPHTNIKEVEITGYRGTRFPNWQADLSFLKLVQLSLRNCKDCYSSPALGQLPCLKFLSIRGMHGITEVTEEFYGSLSSKKPFNSLVELRFEMSMFLEELRVERSDCIDDISPELLPRACRLFVSNCHNLTRVLIPTATERLYIWNCENVEKLSVACGGTQMMKLSIQGCKKLKWLPERMQELLPSLKKLAVQDCPEIESFPQGGLPFNLQVLEINNCNNLVNGRKEWRLQRLRLLFIKHDGRDEEILSGDNWELPSSIFTLLICNLKTLSSQHLKNLTSIQHLYIEGNLPQIQSMLEQGLWHLTSLQILRIVNWPNLQSLSESALPSSLSHLEISHCPNLQSLPVKGMPSSLSKLHIYNCPLLEPLLECCSNRCKLFYFRSIF